MGLIVVLDKEFYCGNRIRLTSCTNRGSARSVFQRGSMRNQTTQCDRSSKASGLSRTRIVSCLEPGLSRVDGVLVVFKEAVEVFFAFAVIKSSLQSWRQYRRHERNPAKGASAGGKEGKNEDCQFLFISMISFVVEICWFQRNWTLNPHASCEITRIGIPSRQNRNSRAGEEARHRTKSQQPFLEIRLIRLTAFKRVVAS